MSRRNKHVQLIVTVDQATAVNEIMLRNGYGPDYLTVDIENAAKTLTHKAVETLVDAPEHAAIKLAIKNIAPTKKTLDVKSIRGRKRPSRKLDILLQKKGLNRTIRKKLK